MERKKLEATSDGCRPDGSLLRFLTCGSVDDGKSTLIGRLLVDADVVPDDSARQPATPISPALVDGLQAEREQGITIDVAYRYFSTPRRRFIVADTPGHEQYTRNMATGASTADLAVILVDATKGLLPQTLRHSAIVALLGIRHVVLAVNKMDLVGYRRRPLRRDRRRTIATIAGQLGLERRHGHPVSALHRRQCHRGRARRMPWYRGPTLLGHLETVHAAAGARTSRSACRCSGSTAPTGLPRLCRHGAGRQRPSRRRGRRRCRRARGARVARIVTYDGDLDRAVAGQAVTLTLDRRGRRRPRRRHRRRRRAAAALRPVRRAPRLDGRRADAAGPALPAAARHARRRRRR